MNANLPQFVPAQHPNGAGNPPPTPTHSVWQHIMQGICKQTEFYFSVFNLTRDVWLWNLLSVGGGTVPIETIAAFPLIQEWYSFYCSGYGGRMNPVELVAEALEGSAMIRVLPGGLLAPETWRSMQTMMQRQYGASPVPTSVSSTGTTMSHPSTPQQPPQQAWTMGGGGGYPRPVPPAGDWRDMHESPSFYPAETGAAMPSIPPLTAQPMMQGIVATIPGVWEGYQQEQQPVQQSEAPYYNGGSFDGFTEGSGMLVEQQQQQQEQQYAMPQEADSQPPVAVVTTPQKSVVHQKSSAEEPNSPSKISEHSSSTVTSKGAYQHKKHRNDKKKGYNSEYYTNNKNHEKKNKKNPFPNNRLEKHEDKVNHPKPEEKNEQPMLKDADFPPLVPPAEAKTKMQKNNGKNEKKKNKKSN